MSVARAEIVNYGALEQSAALNLNPRQISFVDHYLDCKVMWKAAELAGYSGNKNTLHAVAWENLQKPAIKAYYEERLRAIQVSADEVLAELGEIARFRVAEMGEKCAVRPTDKLKALELAGKAHGLFIERSESVNVNISVMGEDERQLRLAELAAKLQGRQGSQDVVVDSGNEHNP